MISKKSSSTAGYRKKVWSAEDDAILLDQVSCIGPMNWNHMASFFPGRTAKQCRERWHNHLTNGIKKGDWTSEEDRTLLTSHSNQGNQWTMISKVVPGRSTIDVKNRYYVLVRERKRGGNKQPSQLPPHFDLSTTSKLDLNHSIHSMATNHSTVASNLLSLSSSSSNYFLNHQQESQNMNNISNCGHQHPDACHINSYHPSTNTNPAAFSSSNIPFNIQIGELNCASEINDINDYTLRNDIVTFYLFLKEVLNRDKKVSK